MPTTKTISKSDSSSSRDVQSVDVVELVDNRLDDFMQLIESKLVQFLDKFEREQRPVSAASSEADEIDFANPNALSHDVSCATMMAASKLGESNRFEECSFEQNPFEEYPVDESSIDENSIEENSVEENSVEENSIDENWPEENPVEENLFAENPFQKNLIEEKSIELKQAEVKYVEVQHASTVEKPMTSWERRKLEILAEYGMPAESETTIKSSPENNRSPELKKEEILTETVVAGTPKPKPYTGPERRKNPRPLTSIKDEALEALHDSIESINISDCEEIAALKESLTAKLREAEIELSINRAKLSQQWAALERRQFEINQKESMLKCKYGHVDEESDVKPRLLDRISRHLSRKSNRPDKL